MRESYASCPYLHSTFQGIVLLVRINYYCETGSREIPEQCYYFDDPLWDGEGCEGENEDHDSVSSCLNQLRMTLR